MRIPPLFFSEPFLAAPIELLRILCYNTEKGGAGMAEERDDRGIRRIEKKYRR